MTNYVALTEHGTGYKVVRENPLILELAEKYKVTSTQVILAWHIARGIAVVPGSKNPEHQKENINVRMDLLSVAGFDCLSTVTNFGSGRRETHLRIEQERETFQ